MKQGALILIIDDEIQIRRFLKMSLAAYGYSVREAENGEEGFRAVFDYNPDVLEKIPNKHDDRDYFVKFNCPEFTSLCPMTGQPDFATIYISYVPDER